MTFFSVIIPTYNRAHIISETLESVLQQTHPAYEIILVDDGSTDNTEQLIRSRYANNEKIKYFVKQNEERGAARNFGLMQATGEYAVFFDSDDWMKPGYLSRLDEVIKNNPGIFLLACHYNYDNKGKNEHHPVLHSLPEGWYDRSLLLKGNFLACNFCIRIKGNTYKPFPPERELASMEDWLFLLRNMEEKKIFIRKEIGVTMRQHDERSMMNNQKVIIARNKATEWLLRNLSLTEQEEKTLKAWSHYFCGIHHYLDHKRTDSVEEALAAIKTAGMNKKFLLLLVKSIAGRKLITSIR